MAGKDNLDDRQIKFLEYYMNPKSETYTNALQSALKAGYEQKYAENITSLMPNWLSEAMGREQRVAKAERVFDECLTMETRTKVKKGEVEVEIDDPQLLKIKQDTAKFIAETIGKDKGYSKRNELTGKNGEPIATTLNVNDDLVKKYVSEAVESRYKDLADDKSGGVSKEGKGT